MPTWEKALADQGFTEMLPQREDFEACIAMLKGAGRETSSFHPAVVRGERIWKIGPYRWFVRVRYRDTERRYFTSDWPAEFERDLKAGVYG